MLLFRKWKDKVEMGKRPEKELRELDKENMNSVKDKVKIQILLGNRLYAMKIMQIIIRI